MNLAKKWIQTSVIKTGSLPVLRNFYEFYYYLTTKFSSRALSMLPEVTSVYLTGGYAAGNAVYGLSDIDLIIFVDGEKARALKTYKTLSFFFPLLCADEPAVYEKREVKDYLGNSAEIKNLFLSHRILPSSGASKLMYGENILPDDSAALDSKMKFASISQTWSVLINKLIVSRTEGRTLGYLCLKLRKQLQDTVTIPPVHKIKNAGAEDADETFLWCSNHIKEFAKKQSWKGSEVSTAKNSYDIRLSPQVLLTSSNRSRIENFISHVKKDFPKIKSILLSPVSYLALEEDRVGVFIVEEEPLTRSEVKKLKELLGTSVSKQTLELYLLTSEVALSVQWAGSDWWHPSPVLWPFSDPLTFLHLQMPYALFYGDGFELSQTQIEFLKQTFNAYGSGFISSEKSKKLHHISHKNIKRLPTNDFQHVFWQALQIKTAEEEKTVICSSEELARHWSQKLSAPWVRDLQSQLLDDLDKKSSRTERYYKQATDFLGSQYGEQMELQ